MSQNRLFLNPSDTFYEIVQAVKNDEIGDNDFNRMICEKNIDEMTDQQLTQLVEAFKSNTSLGILNFTHAKEVSGEMLEKFLVAIESNPKSTVEIINFGSCASNENLNVLAAHVEENKLPQLCDLIAFDSPKLDDEGCNAISRILKHATNLYSINLCHNRNIHDAGLKAIAQGLLKNNSVELAYLDVPNLHDEGATALEEVLRHRLAHPDTPPIAFNATERAQLSLEKAKSLNQLEKDVAKQNGKNAVDQLQKFMLKLGL